MPRPVPSIDTKRSMLALQALVEQVLHAAQVAEAFLADVADEGDGAGRLDVAGLRAPAPPPARTARPRQSSPMPGPRMHRAFLRGLDVGALGEHGVEVRGEHEVRPRRGARALAEHVADLVDAHVLQAELAELAGVELGALRLLERRRLDLADLDLLGQGAGLVGPGGGERGLDRGVLQQLRSPGRRAPC